MEKTLKQWVSHFMQQKRRPPGNIEDNLREAARNGTGYAGYYWRRTAGNYWLRVDTPPAELPYEAPHVYMRQEGKERVALLSTWARELDGTEPRYAKGYRATVMRLLRAEKMGHCVHGAIWVAL